MRISFFLMVVMLMMLIVNDDSDDDASQTDAPPLPPSSQAASQQSCFAIVSNRFGSSSNRHCISHWICTLDLECEIFRVKFHNFSSITKDDVRNTCKHRYRVRQACIRQNSLDRTLNEIQLKDLDFSRPN